MTARSRTWIATTPWPVALTGLAAGGLVLLVAVLWPTSPALPFVGRIAGFALAGCAAYLLDDAAAPLTSVAPQGPWRRRARVLATGAGLIAGAWLGVLLALGWRQVRPPVAEASLELIVLGLVAVAVAAVLIRKGDHEPGIVVAPAVALLGLALVIAEGIVGRPILLTGDEATPGRIAAWVTTGMGALLVALVAARDRPMRNAVPGVTSLRNR